MEDFTAKLRDIQEIKFPIVKAAFKGKDDQTFIGVMYPSHLPHISFNLHC